VHRLTGILKENYNHYHAWERRLCENTNGLRGQHFPKEMSFEAITEQHVQVAMNRLNAKPRKTLDKRHRMKYSFR
jgi:IS30 family transposase